MTEVFQIRTLHDVIKAQGEVDHSFHVPCWWRGQGTDWPLRAGVFREGIGPSFEHNAMGEFRRRARPRHPVVPEDDDLGAWLFLMQHFRLPTRLLDWTKSALTAAYFAVLDKSVEAETGSLMALSPNGLNHSQMGEPIVLQPRHPAAAEMIASAFQPSSPRDRALAIDAHEIDARMMAQLSAFTIHGSSAPLEDFRGEEKFIRKFLIPPDAKRPLSRDLYRMGVRPSTLFPDLEHLAQEIRLTSWDRPSEGPE